jgi:disulfide bond formation protein DsbB
MDPTRLPLFQPRNALLIAFLVSLAALGSALVAQFAFDMKPCVLCLYQRVPYLLLFLGALAGLMLAKPFPKIIPPLLAFMAVLFAASAGVAFFHVGVEQGWWVFGAGCPVINLEGKSAEEALAQLLTTPQADCSKVAWSFLGLSITIWNVLLSLVMLDYLSLVTFLAFKNGFKNDKG